MKNTDVFNQYDMVVSLTQKTINDQLLSLTKSGVVHPQLIMYESYDDAGNSTSKVVKSVDDVPKTDGEIDSAYIDGEFLPSISIASSGSTVQFNLAFRGGTAHFWTGFGRKAQLKTYSMAGWICPIDVNLDLAALAAADGANVPTIVKDQLAHFDSSMFDINHLFMDFESANLYADAAACSVNGEADDVKKQFSSFMGDYLSTFTGKNAASAKAANPFILGYVPTARPGTADADAKVPPLLRPVGTTFTVYHDPANPDLSNINFVLATKGGFAGIHGSPGTFDTNWISPSDHCDAKMIYSHKVLVEPLLLKPLYEKIKDDVYNAISGDVNISQNNDYDQGRSLSNGTFTFQISNVSSGDDQYVNTFKAELPGNGAPPTIGITNGTINVYKHVSKSEWPTDATAWGSASTTWHGSISVAAGKDGSGNPTLVPQMSYTLDNQSTDSGENTEAKVLGLLGNILGKFLDSLIPFDNNFFGNLLQSLLAINVPDLGSPAQAMSDIGSTIDGALILPGGQTFFFRDPAIDQDANLSLLLTYKTEN